MMQRARESPDATSNNWSVTLQVVVLACADDAVAEAVEAVLADPERRIEHGTVLVISELCFLGLSIFVH